MGELIIIGASAAQRKPAEKAVPPAAGAAVQPQPGRGLPRRDREQRHLFRDPAWTRSPRTTDTIDVLVKVIPDRSRFYGFGFGWEERRGPRGTLEYQEKNLFNSISSVAATLQLGVATSRRGILSIDTPYFFKNKITSSFKIWEENESLSQLPVQPLGAGRLAGEEILRQAVFAGLSQVVPHHPDRTRHPGVRRRPAAPALRHHRPFALLRQREPRRPVQSPAAAISSPPS